MLIAIIPLTLRAYPSRWLPLVNNNCSHHYSLPFFTISCLLIKEADKQSSFDCFAINIIYIIGLFFMAAIHFDLFPRGKFLEWGLKSYLALNAFQYSKQEPGLRYRRSYSSKFAASAHCIFPTAFWRLLQKGSSNFQSAFRLSGQNFPFVIMWNNNWLEMFVLLQNWPHPKAKMTFLICAF